MRSTTAILFTASCSGSHSWIRIPGHAPARISTPVSSIDVLPTLLDTLDLPLPPGIQGQSLLAAHSARPLFAEVDNVTTKLALRQGRLKTIVSLTSTSTDDWAAGAQAVTYDLNSDPLELHPLAPAPEYLQDTLEMGRLLRLLRQQLGGQDTKPQALDPATRAQLQSLGYTIGTGD